jgi:hypothetical protein
VFSVGRPGEIFGRRADERSVRENRFDGKRLFAGERLLCGLGVNGKDGERKNE